MGCISSSPIQTADPPAEPQSTAKVPNPVAEPHQAAKFPNPVTAPVSNILAVGERVLAKYPSYRGKQDDPWFCAIVEAVNGDFCDVIFSDGDKSTMLRPEEVCRAPNACMNVGKSVHRFNDICDVLASYELPFKVFPCSSGWVVADDAITPSPSKAGPRVASGTFQINVKYNGQQELKLTPHVVTWKGLNASYASGDACWIYKEDSQSPILHCSFYVPWASSDYCSITGLNETLELTFDLSKGEGTFPAGSINVEGMFQRTSEGQVPASGLSTSDVEIAVKSLSVDDVPDSTDFVCPVCKTTGNKIVTAPCKHTYCIKCVVSACGIHASNQNCGSCPQCAAEVRAQELTVKADDGSAVFIMNK